MVDAESFELLVKAFAFLDIFAYLRILALSRSRKDILRRFAVRRLIVCRVRYWFWLLNGVILVLNEGVDVFDIGSVEIVDEG